MIGKRGMTKLLGFSVFAICALIMSGCVEGSTVTQGPPGTDGADGLPGPPGPEGLQGPAGPDNITLIVTGPGLTGGPITDSGTISIIPGSFDGDILSWNDSTAQWELTQQVSDALTLGGQTSADLDAKYVDVAGDTMTGLLTLSGDPTANLHATTKQYVDAAIGASSTSWRTGGNSGLIDGTDNILGTTDNVALDILVNGARALRIEPTALAADAPNIIGGHSSNTVTAGVVGATISGGGFNDGTDLWENRVTANYGTIGGGQSNTASGYTSTVGGGWLNTASGDLSTVGGGYWNTASGNYATIGGGGWGNTASGGLSTIGGGDSNTVSGDRSTVSGGSTNTASAQYSTIGGGFQNTASLDYATVSGGYYNMASSDYATAGGGRWNTASGSHSTVGGGFGNAASGGIATVGGGFGNDANGGSSTVGGGNQNTASGLWATIGGGGTNTASGNSATIGGGENNSASGLFAAVGGGYRNEAQADFATIAGGGSSDLGNVLTNNRVFDNYGTIGGGGENRAGSDDADKTTATFATVGGGAINKALAIYSTVSGGFDNMASMDYAIVSGGRRNTASGTHSTVGGGFRNSASGANWATVGGGGTNTAGGSGATIGGGYGNLASGMWATIGGGDSNSASNLAATISGGDGNTASNFAATVGGGFNNMASGMWATVGGGESNTASSNNATVGGGRFNTATGLWATVGGGVSNMASSNNATVGGGDSNSASDSWSTVGGGAINQALAVYSTVSGGYDNMASMDYATVSGGRRNTASGLWATVGGGDGNSAIGSRATVGGGQGNSASGVRSTVGGGRTNTAEGSSATVGGGSFNSASGMLSAISGGNSNSANGFWSFVGGGVSNSAAGNYSSVSGGRGNTAAGDFSFAAGLVANVQAAHSGTFLWADNQGPFMAFNSAAANEFAVRATGGVRFVTAVNGAGVPTAGVKVLAAASALYSIPGSDFILGTETFERLRIVSASGNVGIGTATPGSTLDVSGKTTTTDLQVTGGGGPSTGYVLTSDATGNATWLANPGSTGWQLAGNDIIAGDFLGTVAGNTVPLEFHVDGLRALRIEPTPPAQAPNIIGGHPANTVTVGVVGATIGGGGYNDGTNPWENRVTANYGTIGGGLNNTVSGLLATIGGGNFNTASLDYATVSGGWGNMAIMDYATVSGGERNLTQAMYATIAGGGPSDLTDETTKDNTNNRIFDGWGTIGGGGNNRAGVDDGNPTNQWFATVSGGAINRALALYSTVGGGESNTASGGHATVGGGESNTASILAATVGGGESNTASGLYSTVPGGFWNTAAGDYSFAAGSSAVANHNGTFVWADDTKSLFTSIAPKEFAARASGGFRFVTAGSAPITGVAIPAGTNSLQAIGTGDLTLQGNTTINGELTVSSRAYGMVYRTTAFNLTAVNTWFDLPFTGGSTSLFNVSHSTTVNPEQIFVNQPGTYSIRYVVHTRHQGAGHHMVGRIYHNGSAELPGSFFKTDAMVSGASASLVGHVIVSLSAGDFVTVQVGTDVNDGNEVDVYDNATLPDPATRIYASLKIVKIGP